MKNTNNILLENINLKSGKITYNDFDIDPNINFEDQKWSFKEDIFQMRMHKVYTIDIGWDLEFDPSGNFKIVVIKNFDWRDPLFKKKCKDVNTLKRCLQEAIDFVDRLETK